tara:strand:+ start:539 stop:925 length:387 start_codon:yes stop_codon:yes gene_type:complete
MISKLNLKNISYSFIRNFIIGGLGISILGLLIEYTQSGVAYSSYLYSALPTVYFFLFWITYKIHGEKGISNLNIHLILGCIIFILFVLSCHFSHKLGNNYVISLFLATLVFVILSYIYFKKILHIKFN